MDQKPISDIDFCVIDTETTGGSPQLNRIIDVAVLQFKDGEIVDKFQSLINPQRPIPAWVTQLTAINNDMVKDAPLFSDIAEPLKKILDRGVFTAHNANFDYGFVREEFSRLGMPFERPLCCTLKLARKLYTDIPSRSLGMLCDYLLIDIWDRHRAFGDAEATVYVLKDMLRVAKEKHQIETWMDLDTFSRHGPLNLPEGISLREISGLPAAAGTYIFKDQKGELVTQGHSKDVQRRVKTYFQIKNQSEKSKYLREVVKRIEFLSEN